MRNAIPDGGSQGAERGSGITLRGAKIVGRRGRVPEAIVRFWGINPGGMRENSPGFQAWVVTSPAPVLVPIGTEERAISAARAKHSGQEVGSLVLSSLRDLDGLFGMVPSTEVLDYYRLSLRDWSLRRLTSAATYERGVRNEMG
jgi:hypothetical protein